MRCGGLDSIETLVTESIRKQLVELSLEDQCDWQLYQLVVDLVVLEVDQLS